MSYVDTSVIVAALDPLDPRRKEAKGFLEKEECKIVSELVIAELASVIARREELVASIASRLGLSREEALTAILLYVLKRFNLNYEEAHGTSRLPLLGEVCKPIAVAVQLSPKYKLKTLDMLHVAYAKLIKDKGVPIRRLVTVDKDFEKVEELLRREAGISLHIIQS